MSAVLKLESHYTEKNASPEVNVSQSLSLNYFVIRVDDIFEQTATQFDIYISPDAENQRADPSHFVLYAKGSYKWALRELKDLSKMGISKLFVMKKDLEKFKRYRAIHMPLPSVDRKLAPVQRFQNIQEIGQRLIESCFLAEINQGLISQLENLADEMVLCLDEAPQSVQLIQSLAEYDFYTYVHSVGVGTLSAAIAMKMGAKKPEVLRDFAMGGLLHDIGKKLIPLSVLNKPGPLDESEWEIMRSHPSGGVNLMKDVSLSPPVFDMIALHHEKLDGSGYPNGYLKENIPVHVQIATIADVFNALTTTRCYHKKRSRFEGLMFIKHHMSGKVSPDVFRALVACMSK